jgi:hypothetical protein
MKHEILESRRVRPGFIAFAFFVLVALSLTIINRHVIAEAHFELGDFAANSLLIQDAKSLRLLKGNYSRVGFNHPGPAILYVLAGGEVLFYDWTRIAPSPFAGQLIAVAIYSAFWVTLIGAMFHRFSKSLLATGFLLTVFLTVSAFSDYQVFAGIWFPHLYYFPFAVFTLAVARLACGHGDSLAALAISCGFLVNGHVSFVAITASMLGGALLANQVLFRTVQEPACLSWLSWELLYLHRARLLVSLVLVLVFFVPLVIETIVHFPGPIPNYLSYGVGNKGSGIVGSLRFVSSYWAKDAVSVIWGALSLGFVYVYAKSEEYFGDIIGVMSALLVATAGFVFYAKVGIDDLSYKYLGLFYYSAPAIGAATAAYCVYQKIDFSRKTVVAVVTIVIGLSSTYLKVRQPPEYAGHYNQPEVPVLFQKMRVLGRLPLILDLDSSNEWVYIWSTIVGAQAYANRMDVQLFCVNRNWHVLFTDEAKCTESQVRTGNRFVVTKANSLATNGPSLDYLGLSFYRFEPPLISSKQVLAVGSNKLIYANFLLGNGWSGVEGEFVWSVGNEAELFLRITPQSVKKIYLDLAAFLPKQDSFQQVAVKVNDVTVANFIFTSRANRGTRMVGVPDIAGELIKIKLLVSKPTSPHKAKISGDRRKLGVALYGLGVD